MTEYDQTPAPSMEPEAYYPEIAQPVRAGVTHSIAERPFTVAVSAHKRRDNIDRIMRNVFGHPGFVIRGVESDGQEPFNMPQ